jgi:hypothetical protein
MTRPLLVLAIALGVAGPFGREPRAAAGEIRLSSRTIQVIGYRIWRNECDLTVEGLTSWNDGEDFASLGIGHFIWHPKGKRPRITESFPTMLAFLRERQVELPTWLTETSDCPWNSRAEFLSASQDPRMVELRQLLARTVPEQTTFMVTRLREALPRMVEAAPPARRQDLIFQLYRVAQTSHRAGGLYQLQGRRRPRFVLGVGPGARKHARSHARSGGRRRVCPVGEAGPRAASG